MMGSISTALTIGIGIAVACATASPPPQPLPKAFSGAIYSIHTGHPHYLDWKKPQGVPATFATGRITRYWVLTEDIVDYPSARFEFRSDDGKPYSGIVELAQPPLIDGKPYECAKAAATSSSEFIRRYNTCTALPSGFQGTHVRIRIYRIKLPSGASTYAADQIDIQ